jgi:phosphoribosylaminoimidazole-succinocarboxamide synthase
VCGGLEPFDSWDDLFQLISYVRVVADDDIVVFTGYKEDEIEEKVNILKRFNNIIIKFGRYIPNQQPHYDEVLGVNLASDNQYARRVS